MANVIEKNKKSARWAMNFDFAVFIDKLDGTPGESEQLILGVDAVRGLSSAKTNTIRYRRNGLRETSLSPIPGLSTAGTVTMEGLWTVGQSDLKALRDWHAECQGKKSSGGLGGYYRNITIIMMDRAELNNQDLYATDKDLPAKRSLQLTEAICTSVQLGDLDANSEDFAKYTMEIEFKDLEVVA